MWIFGGNRRRQFEQMTRPLLKPLYQTALRLTRQTEWAEDLTQDTLIRAYERFHLFTPGTNFRAWLFTILTHIYLNDCERARRRPSLVSLHNSGDSAEEWDFPSQSLLDDPQAALLTNLLPEHLQEALDALPEEFRITVILVDIEDMNYQEVATALGVPVGTVRSRLSRGRGILRKLLSKIVSLMLV
ncbi:RNA polymerase sigma factor [Armatimonadota bacterium]|nr:RNA polymerase sigma factor [Armatimonadota bacterium]